MKVGSPPRRKLQAFADARNAENWVSPAEWGDGRQPQTQAVGTGIKCHKKLDPAKLQPPWSGRLGKAICRQRGVGIGLNDSQLHW